MNMAEHFDSINSTNEQFGEETSRTNVFRRTRRNENRPLIDGETGNTRSSGSLGRTNNTAVTEESGASNRTDISEVTQSSSDPEQGSGSSVRGNTAEGVSGDDSSRRTLGTLDGVFAPVALSQFSSLLFLRVGYLIGNGGLVWMLGMLIGAYAILVLTVLSICAISTNGAIEGGGAYFMISRTLGPELGGAIGLVFYTANVFSSALYTSGCVEGLLQGITLAVQTEEATNGTMTGPLLDSYQTFGVSFAINFVLLCLCLVGAKMFAKCTNVLFILVCGITVATVFAMLIKQSTKIPYATSNHLYPNNTDHRYGEFTGPNFTTGVNNLLGHLETDYTNDNPVTYMTLFGVLFSGVTGIMAGANMSGELRKPGYSIPRGTLYALTFTFGVYVCLFLVTAFTTTHEALVNNYVFMVYTSFFQPLVYCGIAMATLFSSMSNMIGASRIMGAIVADNVFGKTFNYLFWVCLKSPCRNNEFFAPLLFTFVFTTGILTIGDMNSIAPFTSVFFLLSYCMLNVSCMMLMWAGAPNFRPSFRQYNMFTCFCGVVSSIALMIMLSRMAAFICLTVFTILLIFLYLYHLKFPSDEMQWGSVGQAVLFHTVRKYLLKLDFRREHVKYWRPHLLLLVSNPRSACPLIDTLNDLKKSGIYILGHVRVTDAEPSDLSEELTRWQALVDHLKVKAFVSVTESNSLRSGALQIVRVSGLGALKPNTVMIGFRDDLPPVDFLSSPNGRYDMQPASKNVIPSNWHPLQDRSIQDDEYDKEGITDSTLSTIPPHLLPDSSSPQLSPFQCEMAAASEPIQPERVSVQDYVSLLQDVLNAGKNLAICRNFHLLNKDAISRSRGHKCNVDVWPINFLSPETSSVDDTTALFTLQLGTILNMVKYWRKYCGFRVFLLVPHGWTVEFLAQQKEKVRETLRSVRMNATIETVSWRPPAPEGVTDCNSDSSDVLAEGDAATATDSIPTAADAGETATSPACSSNTSQQLQRVTGHYLSSANRVIRLHSKASAITFLNIPPPPVPTLHYPKYLDALDRLTHNIGPCILVHGISKVTTTML